MIPRQLYLAGIFFFVFLFSCESGANRVTSKAINTPRERIETLKKYFNLKSDILDTEFDIFDVNMNADRSIPGATSRDLKIILYVEKEKIDAWIDTSEITSFPVDYNWIFDVSTQHMTKDLEGEDVLMMVNKSKETIVLPARGIVIIRIRQL